MRPVATDNGWEARMAQRAAARRAAQEAEARADGEERLRVALARTRELRGGGDSYLNGWPLMGDGSTVLMGTWVRCAGCGCGHGITTVAFPEGWEPPGPEPDWPHQVGACPVCELTEELGPIGFWPDADYRAVEVTPSADA